MLTRVWLCPLLLMGLLLALGNPAHGADPWEVEKPAADRQETQETDAKAQAVGAAIPPALTLPEINRVNCANHQLLDELQHHLAGLTASRTSRAELTAVIQFSERCLLLLRENQR